MWLKCCIYVLYLRFVFIFLIKLEHFIFSIKKSYYTDTRFNNITKAYFNHEIITGNFVVST